MKSIISIVFSVLLAAGGILSVSSCKNKCGSTTCQNGGTCTNNVCSCPTGYTGSSCENAANALVIGTYDCTRSNCNPAVAGSTAPWKSAITAIAGNGYQVNISNFDNANTTVQAVVDSANNITITPVSGSYGIAASGSYKSGVITLEYTTSSTTGVGYHCQMKMVKR